MKYFTILVLLIILTGCGTRGHYVHNSLTQAEVDRIDFECRYKANMMSHEYNNAIVSGMVQGEEFGNCMRANGFVFVKD